MYEIIFVITVGLVSIFMGYRTLKMMKYPVMKELKHLRAENKELKKQVNEYKKAFKEIKKVSSNLREKAASI